MLHTAELTIGWQKCIPHVALRRTDRWCGGGHTLEKIAGNKRTWVVQLHIELER